ncbi:MAG: transcription-repair coupling factor, partial [Actinobacteria bacterium BACL2 MAG-121220-bin52]
MNAKLAGFISLSETTHLALEQSEVALISATPALPFLIAERSKKAPQLVITHSSSRASEIALQLSELVDQVAEFPAWESLPHERLSPNSDTVARRIDTLINLDKARVVVTTARALLQPINQEIIEMPMLSIQSGKQQNFSELIQELTHRAYSRVDMVERRGDFAVRGGIIDLFPPLADHPVRIEFFGDEIEEIRYFEVSDQRTFALVEGALNLIPCRELILTPEVAKRARQLASKYPEISEICNKASEGIYSQGLESLLSVLSKKLVPLLELLPKGFEVISLDQERIALRVRDLISTNEEFLSAAWSSAALSQGSEASFNTPLRKELSTGGFLELDEAIEYAADNQIIWRYFNSYGSSDDLQISQFISVEPFKNNFEKLIQQVKTWIKQGFLVIISLEGIGILERYRDIFVDGDIAVALVEKLSADLAPDKLYLTSTLIHDGFIDQELKIVFLTEADITGNKELRATTSRMPSKRKASIDPLELKSGDYVVHEQHGVGRYLELVQRDVAGISREYLVIEYASSKKGHPADRIYVPTDSLEQITRYIGGEAPAVHRIGGGEWIKAKGRAKKAVKEIAGELIRLYAARTSSPGFAFSPDTTWQRELEDSFAYIETPDQLVTINEVKEDMQRPYPMDRIICGDVGYGKTEIAIRAAFKAVQDAKQVAILVPTTLLAQQHLATFTQRYSGFPITVSALSRFASSKEISETLAGLASGGVDIVIGTHRLLSDDVAFRDLGLIIVDEEQRFGVEHKEKLKKLRASVDVLAMSATPIPRTLEMAITGIREMSTITTPPEQRHPVLTYVGAYDEKQVAAAIHRELLRDGQVFYIHNRVESIDEVAAKIRRLVPQASVAIAHGQMSET